MNVIGRFTLRSMKANRKWTVVTLIGIIISTAMIAAVSTFCASLIELMRNEVIAKDGNWHAMVSGVRMRDVPVFTDAGFVAEITVSRDVGYARLEGSKNEGKPYLFIRQFDENSSQGFSTEFIQGRMPQNDGELVLSQHLETNGGVKYHIGDTLTLDVGRRIDPGGTSLGQENPYQAEPDSKSAGETLVPEQTRSYTVVGIIKRPNFEPTWAPGYTAITHLDAKTLAPDDTVTVTLLAGRLNRHFFNDVTTLAKSVGLDDSHVRFHTELLRYHGVVANDSTQNMIYGFAAVFIVIIMIASVALIYNAFTISVSERVSQLGMLASVGATKRQKRWSVYFEGFLLGIIGIPLGLLAGISGIGITLSAIRPLMDSFTNLSSGGLLLYVSPLSVVVAVVLAALTIFISVWIPARGASKIMPIDAIRQSKEIRLTGKAVKTSRLVRALFGFEGEIALKNLKRSRKKYRATVLSLIISLVLFLTVSYYAETMRASFDAMQQGYNFDLAVTYVNTPRAEARETNDKIAALDGVANMAAADTARGFFLAENEQLSNLVKRIYVSGGQGAFDLKATLYCLDDASFDRYARSLGADPLEYRDPAHPRTILINFGQAYFNGKRAAGEILVVKPGDRLLFSSRDPSDGDSAKEGVGLEAGLLTDQRPMGVLISSLDNISAVVSRQVFDVLPEGLKGLDSHGNPSFQSLFLTADNTDALETQIQELTQDLSGNRPIIINITANARSEHNMMIVLGIFIYGFIILISLICIANIFNTVTTNIALRRREFAMLRSVGMTPGSFNRMIRFESIFYGLQALLYGLPISVAVALLLYKMESDVFEFGFSLPWASYGVAVALIFVIVGITMFYSSAKIKKENIVDALKAETM
jgi:putative ABC transport system permease protein